MLYFLWLYLFKGAIGLYLFFIAFRNVIQIEPIARKSLDRIGLDTQIFIAGYNVDLLGMNDYIYECVET